MQRATPYAFLAIAVVVAVGWYMFYWGPTGDSIAKDQAATVVARNQAQQLETQLAQLKKYEGRTAELESKAQALGDRIPKDTSLDTFIQEVNVLATRTGVELAAITPTQPSANGPAGLTTIGFTMEVTGTYPQVRSFLQALAEGDRLVVLDSVSLQAGTANAGAQSVRASLTGRMFTTAAVAGADGSATANAPAGAGTAVNSPTPTAPAAGNGNATVGNT